MINSLSFANYFANFAAIRMRQNYWQKRLNRELGEKDPSWFLYFLAWPCRAIVSGRITAKNEETPLISNSENRKQCNAKSMIAICTHTAPPQADPGDVEIEDLTKTC